MLAVGALLSCATLQKAALAQDAILPGSGSSKEPINVNASGLDYLAKEHKVIYTGGVVARQGDSTLKASILTIFLADSSPGQTTTAPAPGAGGGNQIKRIEATGPVTITSKTQVATGATAVYDRLANTMTLAGNVTLSDSGNVITCAKMVYDLKSSRASCSGNAHTLMVPGQSPTEPGPSAKPVAKKPKKTANEAFEGGGTVAR